MKIIAPIPAFGRIPLLEQTIKRLYNKNGIYKVIVIGHENEAKEIAIKNGADFVYHENTPLGAKWNAGFKACQKFDHDAVIFLGSSDWISDDYLSIVAPLINEFDLIGKLGCHFFDKQIVNGGHPRYRLVHWLGYGTGTRQNEPIGIGRIISKSMLQKINYTPFNPTLDSSLDWSMWQQVHKHNPRIKILDESQCQLVSISTNKWVNKHKFDDHWTDKMPSVKIPETSFLKLYPEIHEI
jgi:hypothetical protein